MKRQLLTAIFLLTSFTATAGSGKAIMPSWASSGTSNQAYIYISNISESVVNVTVTFYGEDGTKYSPSSTTGFSSGNQLSAKSSGYVSLNLSSFNYGFATIEWENSTGDDAVALVAHGHRVAGVSGGKSILAVPINDGRPF